MHKKSNVGARLLGQVKIRRVKQRGVKAGQTRLAREKLVGTSRKSNGLDITEKLLDVLTETWSKDPSNPSVTLSRLKTGLFYGSICRYKSPFGGDREIVFRTRATTLEAVVHELAKMILEHESKIDALRRAVGRKAHFVSE